MKGARTTRDKRGRYAVQGRCDACGLPIHGDYYTEDEVCGGSDGPGFLLCGRARCESARPESVEARRAMYTAQRAKTEAHHARLRAAATMVPPNYRGLRARKRGA